MADNSQRVVTNYSNDKRFLELISSSFNDEEQQLFIQSFKQYLDYRNDMKAFVVNLDDIWQWLDISRKDNAKKILCKNFKENEDFIVIPDENTFQKNFGGSGLNKEKILLNVETFKKFCMTIKTEKADKVRDYYIKMENILFQYIENLLIDMKVEKTQLLTDMQKVMERASCEKHNALLSGIDRRLEEMRLDNRRKELEIIGDLIKMGKNVNENTKITLDIDIKSNAKEFFKSDSPIQESTNTDNQQENDSEPEPKIQKTATQPRGDYVQIYKPDDLTQPVQTFQGIVEATQTVPEANLSQIKAAFQLKTVYKDYRWHLIPRSDPNPYVAKDIGETIDKRDHNSGYIVKLNLDRNEILELYISQMDAQEKDGTKKSWISRCIKNGNATKGIYWERWDNLSEEMQKAYLENHTLPQIQNVKARKIVCKDPNTKEIKETFKSMEEVQRKYGITSKTIKKYVETKEPYKSFLWEIV